MTPTEASSPAEAPVTLRCQFCLTLNRIDLARAASHPKCGKCEKPMRLDRPVTVSEEDFGKTVEGAGAPVIVDFYADWCQPCKMMAPVLDDLASEHEGRVLFAKVDSDRAQALSARLGIRGIPTLIAFDQGREAERVVGFDPAAVKKLASSMAT